MTARGLLFLLVGFLVACGEPSEADRILGRLRSRDPKEVMLGIAAAARIRDQERKAGRPVPTGDNARLVRELERLLATTHSSRLKSEIAGSMALSPIPGPQPALIECARTELDSVASDCFRALASSPDPVHVAAMVEMITDSTIRTEWVPELQVHRAIRSERTMGAIVTLMGLGDAAIPSLAPLVKDGTPIVRELALMSLAPESVAAAEAALPALSDPNWWIRFLAADIIKQHPEHREALRPLLDDPRLDVRREAQEGLGLPIEPIPTKTTGNPDPAP